MENMAEADADVTETTATESFTVEILNVIRDAQQQHGLRHGDYQRYRQYCARRLKRIRKTLHFPQGSKYKVQPKKITEEILKDVKFLHIPLFEAERAWGYAMQLKEEANTEPRKRYHLIGRLRKSVTHAVQLLSLCESERCDARTKLEAQAYCAFLKGSLHFEQEHWTSAKQHFTEAKTIYERLGSALVDEVKEIYLQRVEEISPNIRYCAYNIGDESADSAINDLMQMRMKSGGAGDVITSKLDELIEKTREKQSATFSEVTWRGRTVPVKTEQVRLTLVALQEVDKQLAEPSTGDNKLSYYESLLKDLIEAQQALREDLKDDQQFRAILKGQDYEGKVPNSVYLHTYLCYLRQTKTVERNLLMVESLKQNLPGNRQDDSKKLTKPQDLARLYDIIIQNLSEIPNLPGLEEDNNLAEEVQTRIDCFKAFRVYYIGLSYLQNKKYKEALALFERTLECGQVALEGYRNQQVSQQEMLALEAMLTEVDGQKYSCRAASILDTEDLTSQMSALTVKEKKLPLSDRLDAYFEDPSLTGKKANLVQFPPDFGPVACKPVFFDLANSLIDFPDLSDKVEAKKQAGGLGGFMKGWLGWGGKK